MKNRFSKRVIGFVMSLCLMAGIVTGVSFSASAAGGKLVYAGGDDYFTDAAKKTDSKDDAWD